jgi:hypothetical protein
MAQVGTSDYQRIYRKHWTMNQSQLSPDFYTTYFSVLDGAVKTAPTLEKVIQTLYSASVRRNGQKSIQFSFATKLLHMVDQHLPIYDSQVAEFYFFQVPTGESEERLAKLTRFYEFLKAEYARVLKDGLLDKSIQEVRHSFPNSKLTDEKIIDSLIWAFINLLHKGQITYR